MKKIILKKKDAYDLCSVMGTVVQEQSEKLDFKDVLYIQKSINLIMDIIKDFVDVVEKLNKERNSYVEIANKKITAFKQKLTTSEKDGVLNDAYQKKVEAYVATMLEEAKTEIELEISPRNKELYEGIGLEDVSIELEDDKHKLFVSNFEKYAKEKYINKKVMVETYEKLTV